MLLKLNTFKEITRTTRLKMVNCKCGKSKTLIHHFFVAIKGIIVARIQNNPKPIKVIFISFYKEAFGGCEVVITSV